MAIYSKQLLDGYIINLGIYKDCVYISILGKIKKTGTVHKAYLYARQVIAKDKALWVSEMTERGRDVCFGSHT
jgi:hypothetical protein